MISPKVGIYIIPMLQIRKPKLTGRWIYLVQGHTACEEQSKIQIQACVDPGAESCPLPYCWILPRKGLWPASGLQNHRTRSHVLNANCVMSDSVLSLAPHIRQSPSLVKSAARLGKGFGSLPFNPPPAPKLARGLVNTRKVQGHGLPAIPLPPGLPLTEGQPPQCRSGGITLGLRTLHWSPLTLE